MATGDSAASKARLRRVAVPVVLAPLLTFCATGWPAQSGPIEDLALSGRVVELDTRKPIAGAEVSLGENDSQDEPRKPEQVVTSDADGRFTLRIRRDREGERRHPVVVRVRHRDYIARQSQPRTVAGLREDAARGAKPFFDTIDLVRGEEYRLRVVTPDDEPAEGVGLSFGAQHASNPSPFFYDENLVESDDRGVARVRMLKSSAIVAYTKSERFAQVAQTFNTSDQQRYPGVTLPNDLGKLILSRGAAISGRVVGLDGMPLAGVPLQALSTVTGLRRYGRSDASGAFRLAALSPGGYILSTGFRHAIEAPRPDLAHPIGPKFVQVGPGTAGETIELKEIPSVAIQARFVDAQGRPSRGCTVQIYGQILPVQPAAKAAPAFKMPFDAFFGKPPQNARFLTRFQWSVQLEPDADGRVAARAPKGLSNASIHARDESGSMVYSAPLNSEGHGAMGYAALGVLNEDPAPIEFTAFRSPSLTVRVMAEDQGTTPEDVNVSAYIYKKGRNWGGCGVEQATDGVYRLTGMIPGQPYIVYAGAEGYLQSQVDGVALPEGGSRALTVTLSRIPQAAKVGDLAPPILVTTLDGKARSLADYQGRFLLVTTWSARNTPDAMTKIRAIRDRFGADARLALLGLSYDIELELLEVHVKERKIDWPQARLGAEFSRIQAVYACNQFPCSFLIGPDGAIVALNLAEADIEAAVAKALKK